MDDLGANNVAVYWDFENIHASLCTKSFGPDWYRANRNYRQPALIDIKAMMEYISGLGKININKAYANWSFFHPYSYDLQDYVVDLIQLFPRGSHGKNGADIRMAIEVIEDLSLNPHIGIVVIIGGDSDYIAIAQKVKQKGKTIIGIGVKETTNAYWMKSCTIFRYYSSLLAKSATANPDEVEEVDEAEIDDAKQLLITAINRIAAHSDDNFAHKAAVRPMMGNLDPSFDETNFGFADFSSFLEHFSDILVIHKGEHDHMIAVRGSSVKLEEVVEIKDDMPYVRILRKQQIRMISIPILEAGVVETYNLFRAEGTLESFSAYREKLLEVLRQSYSEITETDVSKIKAILYKAFTFDTSQEKSGVRIFDNIGSADELMFRVRKMLTKRILDNVDGDPDYDALSEILFGEKDHKDVFELVNDYNISSHQRY